MSNRLQHETSPYLLQHQHNPVDWFPWGEDALEQARTQDKPILLSIGYSACHWCHVMERESFENQEVAQLMNENFINIKVDREERPDLDHIYQNVAQAFTRGGGWPLTVFLMPDGRPFYGGTYFPPEDRYGRPGFPRVLKALSEAFHKDRTSIEQNAAQLTEVIRTLESSASSVSGASGVSGEFPGSVEFKATAHDVRSMTAELLSNFDWDNGGVGSAPKFPNSMTLTFLWRSGVGAQNEKAREGVLLALSQMAKGGIYDQLGGGFHRYSVDAHWNIPHFEKMLYDNALLLQLYAEVLLTSPQPLESKYSRLFLDVIDETINYLLREMNSPEGGFYSASDADSEGEEGKFFVWDRQEIEQSLSEVEAKVFALHYGVESRGEGNFEGGQSVLHIAREPSEVAVLCGTSEEEVQRLIALAKAKLLKVRAQRVAPQLDDKILLGWNALAVSGLVWAAQALSAFGRSEASQKAQAAAERCYSFLVSRLAIPQSLSEMKFHSTFQGGKGKGAAFLDDYAFLAKAALDLSRFAGQDKSSRYLEQCKRLTDIIVDHFRDPSGPGYFFTSDDHEKLIQRPKTFYDQAIPSGTAVALQCMMALVEIQPEVCAGKYDGEIQAQLGALFQRILRSPHGLGELLCSALLRLVGPMVVSIESGGEAAHASALLCRNPFVFRRAAVSGSAGQKAITLCHQRACLLPFEDSKQIKAEVQQIISRALLGGAEA